MPPSPRIKATLNEEAYARVCTELSIPQPTVVVKTGSRARREGYVTHGEYFAATNTIRLYIDIDQFEIDNLRGAQMRLCETLLHELRHAWQYFHSRETFDAVVAAETDANGYAARRISGYRTLMRLTRTYPNGGFARLSRHTSRQGV